jgi:hypothetical protein
MIKELIGKTIKSAEIKKIKEEYDDTPYLDIEFTDGSKIRIIAEYGGYTGKSEDEYPRFINIKEIEDEQ